MPQRFLLRALSDDISRDFFYVEQPLDKEKFCKKIETMCENAGIDSDAVMMILG